MSAYSSSRTKRRTRRTRAELDDLLGHVQSVLEHYGEDRISIRHLCYQLSSKLCVIPKTEAAFGTVGKHLGKWRKQGFIPYNRFVDATRWHYGGGSFDDAAEALEDSISRYRKNLWKAQPFFVEVWVEKEAVASIVVPCANRWGIRTFVCRGFASLTSTWEAAEIFKEALKRGKQPVILYFGDHDQSGHWIDGAVRQHFAHYGIADQVIFDRVAVLSEQIKEPALPTRPPKRRGDPQECVEIDTLSSAQIRALLDQRLETLVDFEEWERLQAIEEPSARRSQKFSSCIETSCSEAPHEMTNQDRIRRLLARDRRLEHVPEE
jgi:hypothetical protein